MSQSERILILAALTDGHLAQQILQKLKGRFQRLPFKLEITDDGTRALSEFNQKKPLLVIVQEDLPGMNGQSLIREIRKIDGSVALLFLRSSQKPAPDGVETIQLPIVDFTDLLTKIQAIIPDEIKAKFGLFERNSLLYQKLNTYGEKYRNLTTPEKKSSLVCIPKFFDNVDEGGGIEKERRIAESPHQIAKVLFRELSPEMRKKSFRIELAILGSVTIGYGALRFFMPAGGDPDGWLSLRSVALYLMVFSYFGFFLGRVFDRFVLARLPENETGAL